MAGLLGGTPTAQQVVKLATVQVSTACYGLPKPIVYGTTRISANMIDYAGFQAHNVSTGGKGGGGNQSYSYSADLILALCEGGASGIAGVLRVWKNSDVYNLAYYSLSLLRGTRPQAPWVTWASRHGGRALGYSGTAYVGAIKVDLGSNASVPNWNFEVQALLATELDPNWNSGAASGNASVYGGPCYDAKPSAVLLDLLTNPYYGAGFTPSRVADMVSGAGSYQTYCTACGFAISPAFNEQSSAASGLQLILDATNSEVVWSAGPAGMQLKIVPYGDSPIAANGATYTPNTTPLYDLTYDDFLGVIGRDGTPTGTDAITVERSSVQDIKNDVPVEYYDRTNSYNIAIVDVPEPSDVSMNGLKQDSPLTLHLITRAAHATQISAIRAQRNVYVRNTYTFKVGWKFLLLEPMDLVTLTDSISGLYQAIVRVISIDMPDETSEEDGLTITAEEWPFGIGTAALYTTQMPSGNSAASSPAPAVSGAVVFEPPTLMTESGGPEIWMGACGTPTLWGGCFVWVSLDGGSSYGVAPVGTIDLAARLGILTAALPVHADPDTVDTLAVDLTASAGTLNSTSDSGRDSFATGCLVDAEIVSYQTATLTGANAYDITSLRRGGYGSRIEAHALGAPFCFLDDAMLKVPYNNALVGQTIYVKFQSYNGVGTGVQSLDTCVPYSYVASGTSFPAPPIVTITQSPDNSTGSGGSTSASDGVTVTSSGGVTTTAKVWLTITWTWATNMPTPTGFNVIAFTGADPVVVANYLFDMVTVGPITRTLVIAVTPTAAMSVVNAAVRATY